MGCLADKSVPPVLKIALVGLGGSGKSTIVKQLRIIYSSEEPFHELELQNFKEILVYNAYQGVQNFVEYFGDTDLEQKESRKFAASMGKLTKDQFALNRDMAGRIRAFLEEPAVIKFMDTYDLKKIDTDFNIEYIFKNLDRISEEDFVPSSEDVLMARQRTSGLQISDFTTRDPRVTWKFTDAGGQPTEVRKWPNAFAGARAIIFCVALDEFNVKSEVNPKKTLMEESLKLFKSVIEDNAKDTVVLLFLNKTDLFKKKLGQLEKQFPKYQGGKDYKQAISFISKLYLGMPTVEKRILIHQTCALDKGQMKSVFNQVMDVVIKQRVEASKL